MIRVNLTVSVTSDSHWFRLGPTGLGSMADEFSGEGMRYDIDDRKSHRYMWSYPTIAAEHLQTRWQP